MINVAQAGNKQRRQGPRYQSGPIGRPQDPTLEEQAMQMVQGVATEKATEMADPYLESAFQSVKDTVNPYIKKGVEGVKAAFTSTPARTPGPLTGNMANAATANIGPGGGPALANLVTEGATAEEIAAGAGQMAAPTTAATTAAGTSAAGGAMAGLSAAMPYIGAGLLAGKAFGLFSQGGYVGGPLSKVRYKQSGGPINEEIEVSYGGPLSKGA